MSLLHPFRERSDGRKVRYAVVGAGWIAQEDFMPGVEHTGNSVMTAIVTGDAEKAKQLAEKYDIPHTADYDGYDALLRSGDIDAVYISLPNSQHRDYVVRALEAGVHVLCEKPMAPTEEDCLAMIRASEKSGAKLMIAYRLHFEEATIEAIELVRSGKLGKTRVFSSLFSQQVSDDNSRVDAKNWAGPLPDMGPYPINAVRQLFEAEPTEAFAYNVIKTEPRFAEVDEMITAVLRFPGDRLAHFTVSYGANTLGQYRVMGSEGDLEVTPGYTWQEDITHKLTIGEKKTEKSYKRSDHFGGETQYFSNCVLDDKPPEPDGWEGLADVRVIKAIEESVRTGLPQKIEPVPSRPQRPDRDQIIKLSPVKPGEMVNAKPPEEG
jgi:predicted dehydrogenase